MAMSEARIFVMSHPRAVTFAGAVLGAIGFDTLFIPNHGDTVLEIYHYAIGAAIGATVAGGVAWYLIRDEENSMQDNIDSLFDWDKKE